MSKGSSRMWANMQQTNKMHLKVCFISMFIFVFFWISVFCINLHCHKTFSIISNIVFVDEMHMAKQLAIYK